jgi:ribonuclease D
VCPYVRPAVDEWETKKRTNISQVKPAQPTTYLLLDQVSAVHDYLVALRSAPAVAIDLEANSLYAYQEKVCLVQISAPSANVILDPLAAREGVQALRPLLADSAIRKVFHGADYDIRLLKKDFGFELHNIVDTMVAAQLLGRPNLGLAALLSEEFGIEVDKRYQRANWAHRPLDEQHLRYAALDTAYLLQLWQRLQAQLVHLGRLEWAEEEFRLLEEATPAPAREPSCFDVKGAGRLSAVELSALQNLVQLRDRVAQSWDRPPFKVLPDQVLLGWAQSPPRRRDEVLRTRAANRGILRRLAPQVLQAVRRAERTPLSACPQRAGSHFIPLTGAQKQRLSRLRQVRAGVAQRLGLSRGLLVSSETLEGLSRLPPAEAAGALHTALKRWQQQVLGAELKAVLLGPPDRSVP